MLSLAMRFLFLGLFLSSSAIAAPAARPRLDANGDPLPNGALARLGSARFRLGTFYYQGGTLSPDGKWFAILERNNLIALLDAHTGREVRQLHGLPHLNLLDYAFSPDGKTVALAHPLGLSLYDIDTYRQTAHLEAVGRIQRGDLIFSADGRRLALGKPNGGAVGKITIPIWDVVSGKRIAALEAIHNFSVHATLSADGKRMATWGWSRSRGPGADNYANLVQLWDVDASKELRQIESDSFMVTAAALSPDGKLLATTDRYGSTVTLWDTATGARLHRMAARRGSDALLRFFPDGKRLMACDYRGVAQVWDTATGKRLAWCRGPNCRPVSAAFLGNGQVLLAGLANQALHLWEAPSGRRRSPTEGHNASVRSIAFTRDGRTLISVSIDGVRLWDSATGKLLRHDPHHELSDAHNLTHRPRSAGTGYLLSPDGRFLIETLADGGVRLLDRARGEEICALDAADDYGYGNSPIPAAFSADGVTFASFGRGIPRGQRATQFSIWDLNTGQRIRDLKVDSRQQARRPSVALSPNGKLVAWSSSVYSRNNILPFTAIRLTNIADGKDVCKFPDSVGMVIAMAFSPDGAVLATGGESGPVLLFDASDGVERCALEGQGNLSVTSLAFSPDGRLVAAGLSDRPGENGKVLLWERITGRLRAELLGHHGAVSSLAFSPDGRTLASASSDTTVMLWDMTGRSDDTAANEGPLNDFERARLWTELEGADARSAYRAMARFLTEPKQTMELLRKHVRPAVGKPLDVKRIEQRVADLDSEVFATRDKAMKALEKAGKVILPLLTKTLQTKPSLEKRRRLEQLIWTLRRARPPAELIRPLRAVELLERLGTAEARKLLEALTGGDAESLLTREARAALRRLSGPRP